MDIVGWLFLGNLAIGLCVTAYCLLTYAEPDERWWSWKPLLTLGALSLTGVVWFLVVLCFELAEIVARRREDAMRRAWEARRSGG